MKPDYHGELQGLAGNYLYGWVHDASAPGERLVVEVLLDGTSLGVTVANVFEPDLKAQGVGDGVHGFSFSVPALAREIGGALTARVANTGVFIGQPCALDEQLQKLESQTYTDGGLRITGWAYRPEDPGAALIVCVSGQNGFYQEFTADTFSAAAPGTGRCGFEINLPPQMADGRSHEISLRTTRGEHLRGSPVTIACYPEGELGFFEARLRDQLSDSDSAEVFSQLLQEGEHYAPRSLRFEQYAHWFELFGEAAQCEQAPYRFGVVWVGEQSADKLERSLSSLQAQSYSHWQISDGKEVTENPSSAADFKVLVGVGDTLPHWALGAVAGALEKDFGLLYTDSDSDDSRGRRSNPLLKPAWDPALFCEHNYVAPLCVIAVDVMAQLPACEPELLPYHALRYCMQHGREVRHLPVVCYHQAHSSSVAWDDEQQRQVFCSEFYAQGTQEEPLVSIIIPTRDKVEYLRQCIDSLAVTQYSQYEVIVIDNQSSEAEALDYLQTLEASGVRVLHYDAPFNFAAMNNAAVEQAQGELVCLLNNDVEVITPQWLQQMVKLVQLPDVGAVGAKLLWANNMVQHGGVVLGLNKVAGHYGSKLADEDSGYMNLNQYQHQVSAVTAACLLVSKADYEAVDGFNAIDFPVGFNDVDLCLKLGKQLNKRIVWTPRACLYHFESVSRGKEDLPEKRSRAQREVAALRRLWGDVLLRDPTYNPNLNLDALSGAREGLAFPPRPRESR